VTPAAQGITEEDERVAEQAVRDERLLADGQLLVVRLPHTRTTVVADRVELDQEAPENLLVVSPNEVNVPGTGALIAKVQERYPGGWSGELRSAASGGSARRRRTWSSVCPPRSKERGSEDCQRASRNRPRVGRDPDSGRELPGQEG
jgi:hypothetical protein